MYVSSWTKYRDWKVISKQNTKTPRIFTFPYLWKLNNVFYLKQFVDLSRPSIPLDHRTAGGKKTYSWKDFLLVFVQSYSSPSTVSSFDVFGFAWFLKNFLFYFQRQNKHMTSGKGRETKGPWTLTQNWLWEQKTSCPYEKTCKYSVRGGETASS